MTEPKKWVDCSCVTDPERLCAFHPYRGDSERQLIAQNQRLKERVDELQHVLLEIKSRVSRDIS